MPKGEDGKKAILHFFRDLDFVYNKVGYYERLSRMLDRLIRDTKTEDKERYRSGIVALADTYNYFDDGFLPKLRDDLYKSYLRNEECFINTDLKDEMEELLYSWLVMMYGDYEISPQVGWITDMRGAVKWLDEFMEDWKKEENNNEQ